jgi:hypothetical protein
MTKEEMLKVLDIVKSVRDWPTEMRLTLASRILMSLESDERARQDEEALVDFRKTLSEPLSDADVRRIKDYHLMRKYGDQ